MLHSTDKTESFDDGVASLPTPPLSDHQDDDLDRVFREFIQEDLEPIPPAPCDIVFVTSDCANVHAHSHVLLTASHNAFNHILAPADKPKAQAQAGGDYFGSKPLFYVPEPSAVFNIIIHAIYRVSCAHHHPTFDALLAAVDALPKYGVDLHASDVLAPTPNTPPSPLFAQLLLHAPGNPDHAFDLYALAAQHGLHALAVAASAHLRAVPLHALTDDMVQRVGAVYLKKLFFMHLGRADALKGLLFPPPSPHAHAGKGCTVEDREAVSRAWSFAAIGLAAGAGADVQENEIRAAFRPVADPLACALCRATVTERVDVLCARWAMVTDTII